MAINSKNITDNFLNNCKQFYANDIGEERKKKLTQHLKEVIQVRQDLISYMNGNGNKERVDFYKQFSGEADSSTSLENLQKGHDKSKKTLESIIAKAYVGIEKVIADVENKAYPQIKVVRYTKKEGYQEYIIPLTEENIRVEQRSNGINVKLKTNLTFLRNEATKITNVAKDIEQGQQYKQFLSFFEKAKYHINAGVAIEAFEILKNMNIKNPSKASPGKKWMAYRMASGSNPFYRGGDIGSYQLKKSTGASLTSLLTIKKALDRIYNLTQKEISEGTKQECEILFRDQKQNLRKINDKMLEAMGEDVVQEYMELLNKMKF